MNELKIAFWSNDTQGKAKGFCGGTVIAQRQMADRLVFNIHVFVEDGYHKDGRSTENFYHRIDILNDGSIEEREAPWEPDNGSYREGIRTRPSGEEGILDDDELTTTIDERILVESMVSQLDSFFSEQMFCTQSGLYFAENESKKLEVVGSENQVGPMSQFEPTEVIALIQEHQILLDENGCYESETEWFEEFRDKLGHFLFWGK